MGPLVQGSYPVEHLNHLELGDETREGGRDQRVYWELNLRVWYYVEGR